MSSTTAPSAPPSSTEDPNASPNRIPYNVGEIIALPGGWRVQVVRVRRGYTAPGLAPPALGEDHVAVDVRVTNDEHGNVRVDSAALFTLLDQSNNEHPVVAVRGHANGLDGPYPAGTERTGTLVFSAPVRSQLLMMLDGPAIGSQQSIFQVDPPQHSVRD